MPCRKDERAAAHSLGVLKNLVVNAAALGCSDVVIPCVDQSSLGGSPDIRKRFVEAMDQMAEDVAKAVDAAKKDGRKAVLFRVERGDNSRFVALPMKKVG